MPGGFAYNKSPCTATTFCCHSGNGRGDWTRTSDPLLPKQVRYHCATPRRSLISASATPALPGVVLVGHLPCRRFRSKSDQQGSTRSGSRGRPARAVQGSDEHEPGCAQMRVTFPGAAGACSVHRRTYDDETLFTRCGLVEPTDDRRTFRVRGGMSEQRDHLSALCIQARRSAHVPGGGVGPPQGLAASRRTVRGLRASAHAH
jgi:hypothetical protein